MNDNAIEQLKAGGLNLVARKRCDQFTCAESFWIQGEWYYYVCELFNRTGPVGLEHIKQLRAMGHTVTVF